MNYYRYIGAFPLILRTSEGENSWILHYGEEFASDKEIVHELVKKITVNELQTKKIKLEGKNE